MKLNDCVLVFSALFELDNKIERLIFWKLYKYICIYIYIHIHIYIYIHNTYKLRDNKA